MRRLASLGLLSLLFVAYSGSFYSPFVFDDDHFIIGNPSVNFHAPISLRSPRALTMTTYRLNYLVGQDNPFGYHVVNFIIHSLNVVLVGLLLSPLAGQLEGWLASALFAIHPLQIESVTYLSGRTELLMCLFTLLALLTARKGRYILSGLCCLLAIMSKESGIVAIPLVGCLLWWNGKVSTRAIGGLAAIVGCFGGFRYFTAGFISSGRSLFAHDLIQNAQLWQYVGLFLYPSGLSIDHDPETIPFWLQLAAAGASAIVLLLGMSIWRGLLPALAWISIALAPRFLVSIPEYIAEHHLYLPMVAMCALTATLIIKAGNRITMEVPQCGISY